ncbi:MAG: S41 family peptidase [Bacteroidota bacterium]
MKSRFVAWLIFLMPFILEAQVYTKEQLQTDFSFLISNIKTYNPALYKYNKAFDEQVANLTANLPEEANSFQHLSLVYRLVALANEGHFGVGFWQDSVHSGILDGRYQYLPVSVEVLNGKVYVWSDLSDNPELVRGDEIISINGDPIAAILEKLNAHLFSDGDIVSSKYRTLSNVFPAFYYLLIDQPKSFKIVAKDKSGKEKEVLKTAIDRNRMIENAKASQSKQTSKPKAVENEIYDFNVEGKSAYLKLKTFNRAKLKSAKIKAKSFYKMIFKELSDKAVKALTLDLRGNSGGRTEYSDVLVSYVLDENMDGYHKKTVSWEGKTRTYGIPKKKKKAFNGGIFVLIDGGTFSAASIIARNIREYHDDTVIVGEESAGRYEGFAAGSSQTVYLPESNLRINIPRYLIELPVPKKEYQSNRGVIPDHPITYTIEDVIEQRDKAMNLTKQLTIKYLNGN